MQQAQSQNTVNLVSQLRGAKSVYSYSSQSSTSKSETFKAQIVDLMKNLLERNTNKLMICMKELQDSESQETCRELNARFAELESNYKKLLDKSFLQKQQISDLSAQLVQIKRLFQQLQEIVAISQNKTSDFQTVQQKLISKIQASDLSKKIDAKDQKNQKKGVKRKYGALNKQEGQNSSIYWMENTSLRCFCEKNGKCIRKISKIDQFCEICQGRPKML